MIDVGRAVAALEAGEVVAIPTDTVYGVAVCPDIESALRAVFRIKGRSRTKALPVLGADMESLSSIARFDVRALQLAERHWPGPLTLVLPRAPGFSADLGGDGTSVAVRVSDHPVALDVLSRTGPLAVTSANRSGEAAAQSAGEVRRQLGAQVTVIVDAGRCTGRASAILSLVGAPRLLRPGELSETDLQIEMS